MDFQTVHGIIHKISEGFEDNAMQCLNAQSSVILDLIREQIKSGVDGDGKYLSPTYDDDEFFEKKGRWHHRSSAYKAWKQELTPPEKSPILGLQPRPVQVPNLYIDGTFFGQINAMVFDDGLEVSPGNGNGPAIIEKYGERLFLLGSNAVQWFNREFMLPAIEKYFKDCGYR